MKARFMILALLAAGALSAAMGQTGSGSTSAAQTGGQAFGPSAQATAQTTTTQSSQAGISEQVEVTREYTPDLDRSVQKLDVQPTMVDTTTLRPEFTYSIRPTAYANRLTTSTVQPIGVDVENYRYTTPYYLKLGVGWPWRGVADLHIAQSDARGYTYGARFNHMGRYDKAPTELGERLSALDVRNEAGVFLGKEFGRRYDWRVAVDGNYDLYDAYGVFALADHPLTNYGGAERLNYKGANVDLSVGNDFSDLSYFNFRVGGDVDLFADKRNVWENRLDAFVQIGKEFAGVHRLTLKGAVRKYFGADAGPGTGTGTTAASSFTLTPRYALDAGNLSLSLGANVTFETQKTWIFPTLSLRYDLFGGYFMPFIEVDGHFEHGDMRLTAQRNPYVEAGQRVADMGQYNLRGGIMGSLSSRLSYKLYAGANIFRGMSFFANNYAEGSTSRFVVLTDNCTAYTLGGNLDLTFSDRFKMWASANVNAYHMDTYKKGGGLPMYDVSLGTEWNFATKWSMGLTGALLGQRYFYERIAASASGIPAASGPQLRTNRVDPVFDLGAKLAYRHSRFISFWLEGSNLLNSRLYPYNRYRSVGASVMAGVILSF